MKDMLQWNDNNREVELMMLKVNDDDGTQGCAIFCRSIDKL